MPSDEVTHFTRGGIQGDLYVGGLLSEPIARGEIHAETDRIINRINMLEREGILINMQQLIYELREEIKKLRTLIINIGGSLIIVICLISITFIIKIFFT
jgi:hypothetical protein